MKRPEVELVMEGVDVHDWGPTDPDEEETLTSLGYVLDPKTGIFGGEPPS
jgi:hypothetical protein